MSRVRVSSSFACLVASAASVRSSQGGRHLFIHACQGGKGKGGGKGGKVYTHVPSLSFAFQRVLIILYSLPLFFFLLSRGVARAGGNGGGKGKDGFMW